jgi:hypothetical protein
MIKKWMTAAVAAATLVTPVVLAPSAQAAVTCSGFGCDGKDPMVTHCNEGAKTILSATRYVVNSKGVQLARVELRYSPTCKTNWGRVTAVNSTTRRMQADVHRYSDGATRFGGIATAPSVWSAMLYAPGVCADARGRVFFSDGTSTTARSGKACG